MKKKQFSFLKLVFAAVASVVLYALLMKFFFKAGWNFDIFSARHWQFALNKWRAGWVIKGQKDVLFFLLVLSFLPGWIIATYVVYCVPFKKILMLPVTLMQNRKRKQLQQRSLDMARGVNVKIPVPAKPRKNAMPRNDKIDMLRGRKSTGSAPAPAASVRHESAAVAPADNEDDYVYEDETTIEDLQLAHLQRWNEIVTSLENQGLFCFRSTKIGNFAVKLTILVKDTVFWFVEGPLTSDRWTLNDDKTPAVWTGENETIPSPLQAAYRAREKFKNYLEQRTDYASAAVHAFLVMDAGSVKNPDKITNELADLDIALLKIPPCADDELTDLSALLDYIKTLPPSEMAFNDAVAEAIMALEED